MALIEEAVQQTKALGMMFCHTISLNLLGEAYLLTGRNAEANEVAERSLKLCREFRARGYEAWSLRLLGDIFSSPGSFDSEKSETYYREAMVLANELGMRPLIAHCHEGMGKLFAKVNRTQEARDHLSTAVAMYGEMEMNYWLEKAKLTLNSLI